MAKDVLFKTMTFGGFNKEDVLEYIRAQQTQLTDTQRKLKETEENAAAASKRTRELETLLSEQQTRAEEYFALSEEYAKKIFTLEDEVNALNEKLNSVEVGCERAKDVEGQIGALVLDALLYSDKIIRSAKASAKGISNQTRQTIEEAEKAFSEREKIISHVQTMSTIAYIRHTVNTLDEFYEKENDFNDENAPLIEQSEQKFTEAMLGSPLRAQLEEKYGKLMFVNAELSRRCFSPEIIPDLQEENKLSSEYQKLMNFINREDPKAFVTIYNVSSMQYQPKI